MLRDIIKAQVISQMKLEEISKLGEKSKQYSNELPSSTPCPPRPCPSIPLTTKASFMHRSITLHGYCRGVSRRSF